MVGDDDDDDLSRVRWTRVGLLSLIAPLWEHIEIERERGDGMLGTHYVRR